MSSDGYIYLGIILIFLGLLILCTAEAVLLLRRR